MQQHDETPEHSARPAVDAHDVPISRLSREVRSGATIDPQGEGGTCGCGGPGASPNGIGIDSYVYAIGRVEARFPNLGAEKEYAQATGRTETAGKTDRQTFHGVLSK